MASTRYWYKENEFCDYHRQRGHDMSGCMRLKHEIQYLIDKGLVSMGNPVAPPNQHLGIFINPLPKHDVNHISISSSANQNYHNVEPPLSYDYVG